MNKNIVIIVCSGIGSRMELSIPKQFLEVNGKPIVCHTIEKFQCCEQIHDIIIVTNKEYINFFDDYNYSKIKKVVAGGSERLFSVYNGLKALENPSPNDIILVHDGVRPFISCSKINTIIEETLIKKSCVLGVKVKDTIKSCDNGIIVNTPTRDNLWIAQTPQSFMYSIIMSAYHNAINHGISVTDDASLVELMGEVIHMVEGEYSNIKVTTQDDLLYFYY